MSATDEWDVESKENRDQKDRVQYLQLLGVKGMNSVLRILIKHEFDLERYNVSIKSLQEKNAASKPRARVVQVENAAFHLQFGHAFHLEKLACGC